MTMMPARTAIAAVLVGVLIGVSGCGLRVPGADGDLVDDWQLMATPKFDLPSVGMCLDSPSKMPFDPAFVRAAPIECDRGHTLEVVLIGTVEGNAAQASEPPAAGSEGFQAAYAACSKAASDYAGGDWHAGMLGINVQMPTRAPWEGGLRSYVCSIFALSSAYGVMSFTSGSLKGSLTGDAPKAIRCLEVVGNKASNGWWDRISALTPIDCAQPHEAEFVGTIQVGVGGGALPAVAVLEKWTTDHCWPVVAMFMGLTDAQFNTREDVGLAWDGMGKFQWDSGDRHQRCFALLGPGKKVRASIKGLGKKPLPV
ncbi:septum formation family protein [Dactylosporangium fulvum]|uniref:Septum formation family protein n=1 Tax=Dactylosporangium fulvum TaxID=53359 RepID=A0ABY5WAR3_9ACTN|nr:septum formation family protein [Dactylosporangium fulvum]UWP86430.1 septum formation family protein [Dactylosporangium fulvum]